MQRLWHLGSEKDWRRSRRGGDRILNGVVVERSGEIAGRKPWTGSVIAGRDIGGLAVWRILEYRVGNGHAWIFHGCWVDDGSVLVFSGYWAGIVGTLIFRGQ